MSQALLNHKNKFIKELTADDYKPYHTYNRMVDVLEIVRKNSDLPVTAKVVPIQIKGLDGIYFMKGSNDVVIDWKCVQKSATEFELQEMKLDVFNRYESEMNYMINIAL